LLRPTLILSLLAASLAICGFVAWSLARAFITWVTYDPKEAALASVSQYLNAAYAYPTAHQHDTVPSCGGLWATEACWKTLQDAVIRSANQYTLTVAFYNWEGPYPGPRGGDEITVQVDFANGQRVLVYTYESCIDYCTLESERLSSVWPRYCTRH
jgi:hypothetical protein